MGMVRREIARRRMAAVLLLAAGLYLCARDVLYDLPHGVKSQGRERALVLVINVLTPVLSAAVLRWAWRRRDALLHRP